MSVPRTRIVRDYVVVPNSAGARAMLTIMCGCPALIRLLGMVLQQYNQLYVSDFSNL